MPQPPVSSASMAPTIDVSQLIVRTLSAGWVLDVVVEGETHKGVVTATEAAPPIDGSSPSSFIYATVHIPDLDHTVPNDWFEIQVAIHEDRTVNVMPPREQP